jgi:RNA polymerase sigma-70 factor (ECF subfamily)
MSQRLVRAKLKIRDAAIPFRVPDPPEWSERLSFVLDAIYATYTTGWESLPDTASTHHALATDAIALGRVVAQLMPDEPEAAGLLALMLHCEARREARYTERGEYVPLDRQDTAKWSRIMIDEAERYLRVAAGFKRLGRFQLEAAIQSVHASRAQTGRTEWSEIAFLYEALVQVSPGIGSLVGRAVAVAQAGNPAAGLTALDAMPPESIKSYQPYWAARGHLLFLLLRNKEARLAWERAAGLTDDPALRRYLGQRAEESGGSS